MRKSNQGFTYPLTLCLLILFTLFFSMHVNQLISEIKIAHETTALLQQDYYFLSSVKKLQSLFQTSGSIPAKGTMVYSNGTMDYQAETPSGFEQKVNFTLILKNREPISGHGYFDTRSKKVVKWVEVK